MGLNNGQYQFTSQAGLHNNRNHINRTNFNTRTDHRRQRRRTRRLFSKNISTRVNLNGHTRNLSPKRTRHNDTRRRIRTPRRFSQQGAQHNFISRRRMTARSLTMRIFRVAPRITLTLARHRARRARRSERIVTTTQLRSRNLLSRSFRRLLRNQFIFQFNLATLRLFVRARTRESGRTQRGHLSRHLLKTRVVVRHHRVSPDLTNGRARQNFDGAFFHRRLLNDVRGTFCNFQLNRNCST